jgi:phospholipase D1/2
VTRLLVPGRSCAALYEALRAGVLVDGRDFYLAIHDAACRAERSILMAGWQFASKVELVRGGDATLCEHPARLVDFLRDLCERKPELEVHILAWDASAVFTFEREPLQRLRFRIGGHERIHYKTDNAHPFGASHHQKLIVIDRSIAFLGGMDVTNSRWDDRAHEAENPLRREGRRSHGPYHDVQAYVTGEPVDVLRGWFARRWRRATGTDLPDTEPPRREIQIRPSFEVAAPRVGLARTLPRMEDPPLGPVKELSELHLCAIAAAKHFLYLETQYFTCDELCGAFERRMTAGGPPLEIVLVLPEKSAGWKERITIGVYQQRILERLGRTAEETGHHLGVYYPAAPGEEGDVPVFIHSKVLAVDDRFLLVSSANATNRSMGFDTELGVAWEASSPTDSLRDARLELLAEHCGISRKRAHEQLGPIEGLVARLDELARGGRDRLRIHRRNVDEKPGPILSRLLPAEALFDPDDVQSMEALLPEPGAWLDRLIRDPLTFAIRFASRRLRHLRRLPAG